MSRGITAFDFFGDPLRLHDRVRVFGRGVPATITKIEGSEVEVSIDGERKRMKDAQLVRSRRYGGDLDQEIDRG